MSDTDEPTPETGDEHVAPKMSSSRRRRKRTKRKDAWLQDHYDPTEEDIQRWEEMGFPPHLEIVAGFLMSNNLVFGVPDKAELFRLDKLTREGQRSFGGPDWSHEDYLRLHYVQPTPLPFVLHTLAHPPIGVEMGDIVEVNYNVRLQALVRQMWLVNVRVLHGSETDDSPKVVFEGTEYPGAAANHQIRVVRITVRTAESATWETVAESTYPRNFM